MKKIFKALGVVIASGAVVATLASCSNVTQDYADKIVEKAEDKKNYTYEEVMKKLGDEAINGTIEVAGYRVGVIIGVKGIKTKEDLQAKIDAGEDVEGIVVTIANGKATTARYGKINASDLKLMK
ncbi:MAG: hypothetical protein HP024_03845 [Acholeplasmatales bacterium]|nr:hypothetical protein [Acholeplasmatales bacterium]